MKLQRFFLISALVCSVVFSFAQDANEKWTLEKCMDYASKNNLAIRSADINTQINRNNYVQSYTNLLPGISAALSNDYSSGRQFNVAAFGVTDAASRTFSASMGGELTLFSGLQQVHNILKSKFDLEAAKFDAEDARKTIALNITTAFLQIMLNREILRVAENQKAITTRQQDAIDKRVKAGLLPEINLLDIEAQLARDESNITSSKSNFDLAILGLRLILQVKPEDKFEVEIPELKKEVSENLSESIALRTYNSAVITQPSILAAISRLRSAGFAKKMAWGTLSPTLSFQGSIYDYYNNQTKYYDSLFQSYSPDFKQQFRDQLRKGFSVTLSVPIFSKWQRVTGIQNAKLSYQLAEIQVEQKKNALLQTIYQADADARAAANAYFASKKSYEASKRAFDAQEKRYNAGASSQLDYQTAKNNLATAESDMLRNKYTYVFRLKVLDFYNGKTISLNE